MCGRCGEGWRFEATVLGGSDAGRVKAVLHPLSGEWEEAYCRPSTGSLLLATQDPSAEDLWPGATGLYISQIMPDGSRRARFGGYIEKFSGSGGGALTVALQSMDNFLSKRLVAGPDCGYWVTSGVTPALPQSFIVDKPLTTSTWETLYSNENVQGQAGIAAEYVNLARGGLEGEGFTGIPTLTAVVDTPADIAAPNFLVNWWEHKNIGQQIAEMVEVENGVKYRLEHLYDNGYWNTIMHFSDSIGEERTYTIRSDREGWQYGLEIDSSQKATRVYGVGSGQESDTLFSVAYDSDNEDNLPEHQATVAWTDQADADTLKALTVGYTLDHRDPVTVPSSTILGLPTYDPDAPEFDPRRGFPGPEICQPGDTFDVEIGYGAITVHGLRARALAIAWSLPKGKTVRRTIAMQPLVRANDSVRTQVPDKPQGPTQPVDNVQGAPVTTPWPKAGLVTKVTAGYLTEISGMQASVQNPGHVWVMDDEQESPQVSLISLKDGHAAATFNLSPGVSATPTGDPEAIRLSRKSARLVLADIGDNDLNRPTSGSGQPHLLSVAEPKGGGYKGTLQATKYPIAYPGGARVNCETLLIHPLTDEVFLISKESNRARVFSYGPLTEMSTTNNVGQLVATLTDVKLVADGTHTWTGNFVLLRSAAESGTVVYHNVGADPWRRTGSIPTPPMTKGEAITVESTCALLVTSEGEGAPIYRVLIPKILGALCDTPAGPVDSGTGGSGTPIDPAKTVPGQLINLNGWKLQLPI